MHMVQKFCKFLEGVVFILAFGLVSAAAQDSAFLAANGVQIRDGHGAGRVVQLRGVNVGGWLEWQDWMCPMDSSGTLRDANPGHNGYDYEVRHLLENRFGSTDAENLVSTYEDAWFNLHDLDNIKNLGMNAVRLTFAYDTLMTEAGTFRPDGFKKMDWLIENAWKQGIYTIVDFHAFLPALANQDGSSTGYWKQDHWKSETAAIWKHIAEHYRGNPAVAMYDLLNEPNNSAPKGLSEPSSEAVCAQYAQIYSAIRSSDPDHIICMEGMWDWHSLNDPQKCGYRNVVYSFHFYHFGAKDTADNDAQTLGDIKGIHEMQSQWKVPAFVGEFNFFGSAQAWDFGINAYNQEGLSWTMWSYKNKAGHGSSWGVYDLAELSDHKACVVPDLTKDSAEEIRQKWQGWATEGDTFVLNPMFSSLFRSKEEMVSSVDRTR